MKRYFSLLMAILGFIPILAQQSDYYYYYKGERIYLTADSTRLHVVSKGEFQPQSSTYSRTIDYQVSRSTKSYIQNSVIPLQKQRAATSGEDVYFSTLELSEGLSTSRYNTLLTTLKADNNVLQVLPTFLRNGRQLEISNNFLVRLHHESDIDKLDSLASIYNIKILGLDEYMPLYYILSCDKSSAFNAAEAANVFYESGLFASSEPEMFFHNVVNSYCNDIYYGEQWNLNSDIYPNINAEEAWGITKGKGVKVAVYDHGIQLNHPDLEENISTLSFDAVTNTSPSVIRGKHGTACAGIIGAVQNNEIGVTGIAPEAKLMSISLHLNTEKDCNCSIARGFYWAVDNGADVISCSWSGYEPSDVINRAIQYALDNGRNHGNIKHGTVIVCSAGNDYDNETKYPSNYDPRIICVGATERDGTRMQESNYGETLDVVAPGVDIYTTDLTGEDGYEWRRDLDYDYYNKFKRTSAACPQVASVAALILSVHPDLTVEQVASIIEHTAQKVRPDRYNYQNDNIHTSGTWNDEMGYGLLDAGAAVDLALKASRTTYYRDTIIDDVEIVYDYVVDLEDVTVAPPYGSLEIDKVDAVILRSSVIVERGGRLIIFKEPFFPLE